VGTDETASAGGKNMASKIPATFEQALKAGYHVQNETSQTKDGKRTGTLHLKNGSRPDLTVTYEADRTGYRFSSPKVL
jgi:hypothetical protein